MRFFDCRTAKMAVSQEKEAAGSSKQPAAH